MFTTKVYESDFGHFTGIVYDENGNISKVVQFKSSPYDTPAELIRSARQGFRGLPAAERSVNDPEFYANEISDYDELVSVIDSNTVTIYDTRIRKPVADMFGIESIR